MSAEGKVKESQLENQIDKLERAASSLDSVVSSFESRLSNVLRESTPPPETSGTEAEEIESVLVPAAHQIRNQRRRIASITARLEDLFGRLEN